VDKVNNKQITNTHYVGDEIKIPDYVNKNSNPFVHNDKIYTFKGWKLIEIKNNNIIETIDTIKNSDWEQFDEDGNIVDISTIPEKVEKVGEHDSSSYIYCAVYSSTYTPYTITFVNYNGEEL
jgi:hypothetical protein